MLIDRIFLRDKFQELKKEILRDIPEVEAKVAIKDNNDSRKQLQLVVM